MPRSGSLAKVVSHLSTVGRLLPLHHIYFSGMNKQQRFFRGSEPKKTVALSGQARSAAGTGSVKPELRIWIRIHEAFIVTDPGPHFF